MMKGDLAKKVACYFVTKGKVTTRLSSWPSGALTVTSQPIAACSMPSMAKPMLASIPGERQAEVAMPTFLPPAIHALDMDGRACFQLVFVVAASLPKGVL